MIIRVFRGRVAHARGDAFLDWARDVAIPRVRAGDGLRDLLVGTRRDGASLHALVASAWVDLESEIAALGDVGPRAPALELPDWVHAASAEHYESIEDPLVALGEPAGSCLRVLRLVLRPNVAASFFDHVRRQQEELRASGGLVAALIGRRTAGPRDEYTSIALWRSDAALAAATGGAIDRPVGWDELAEWVESYESDAYDAIATSLAPI